MRQGGKRRAPIYISRVHLFPASSPAKTFYVPSSLQYTLSLVIMKFLALLPVLPLAAAGVVANAPKEQLEAKSGKPGAVRKLFTLSKSKQTFATVEQIDTDGT